MNDIACENPRIIVNPSLPELLLKHRHYYWRGDHYEYKKRYLHKFDFNWSAFSVRRNKICMDDVDSSFVCDVDTGETFPIYYVVPCNHCSLCRLRKVNDFVKRCEYESQMYDFLPWFVTLTYAPEFLPKDGVSVDDCQRFLKRFRINLSRAGYRDRIRYVLVSEYGSPEKTWRPHYHVVFWNLHPCDVLDYDDIGKILEKSWSQGFVKHRLVTVGDDDKGFFYTFKYVKKGADVPPGKNPAFVLSSRRGGGIGSGFIDSVAHHVRSKLDTTYKYLDKWTGKIKNLVFFPYVLNRLFPSFSRLVSCKFRKLVCELVCYGKNLEVLHCNLFDERVARYMRIAREYGSFFYVGWSQVPPFEYSYNSEYRRVWAYDLTWRDLKKLMPKYTLDFMRFAKDMQCLREKFLGKLFQVPRTVDKLSLVYNANLVLNAKSPYSVFH